jgi:DNA-binding GntR family transcriptional regulator
MTLDEDTNVTGSGPKRSGPLLRERVTTDIRRLILANDLKPGEPLREEHLANRLGVSRGPIREAIVELEREGLAQRRTGRSTVVLQLSQRDLEEVYSLRRAQEGVAISFAIRSATDFELFELGRKVDAQEAVRVGDNQLRNRLDLEFHDYVYRIARHTRLYQTWLTIRTQVFMFLCMRQNLSVTPEMQDRAIAGHREIVEALIARDEPRALRVADDHLVEAYARSIAAMPDWLMQDDSASLPAPPSLGDEAHSPDIG